jgi:citrate lyase subunit beta/citryl-CoA lyase
MTVRPRRSVLYMPGSNARALEKARELPADGLILDLEDAVAPEAKGAGARGHRQGAEKRRLRRPRSAGADQRARHPLVGRGSRRRGFGEARCDAGAEGLDPGQLQDLAARIVDMGADPHIRVWAMMETPLAMLNVGEIAASRSIPRRGSPAFVMGTNDLAKDTRARLGAGPRADAAVADDLRRRRARLRPRHPRRRL